MAEPDLILLGYGVRDSLQLTVEAQRVLTRVGRAYAIGVPTNLARFLKSLRIEVVDLGDRFVAGREFAEIYLEIADTVLKRVQSERPLVLLTQGNPLFLNSVARFIVQIARKRGVNVQVLPGVSELDVIISYLGLDVATFGVQVFQAGALLARRQQPNTRVPLVLCQVDGLGLERATDVNGERDLQPLAAYLARHYPANHRTALITLGIAGPSHRSESVERLPQLLQSVQPGSFLFIDAVSAQDGPVRPDSPSGAAGVAAPKEGGEQYGTSE